MLVILYLTQGYVKPKNKAGRGVFTVFFELRIRCGLKEREKLSRGSSMPDWAQEAAGRFRQKRETDRLRMAQFVEQQRIKKARGPALWNQVKDEVKRNCEAFNVQASENILSIQDRQHEIVIHCTSDGEVRDLVATYDYDDGILVWSMGQKPEESGQWELSVTQSGGVQFVWNGGIPSQPTGIATQMLNHVLGLTI
jgi:hypothetical protein